MPELRLNLVTREWVIIGREKGKRRPEDFVRTREHKKYPELVETCPFCPGNESKTLDEVHRTGDDKGWRTRVVPNKFAVLSKDGERTRQNSGLRKSVNGVGSHEVIIESPLHNITTATMLPVHLEEVIQTYRERFLEIYTDPRIEHVVILKNSGPASGTTIEHSHSQVAGLPITPFQIRSRIENAMRFFDESGDCLMCRLTENELNDGSRILLNTEHFVSFVPYAALSAFHVWIFPKRHSGSFSDIRPEEIRDLALNLKATMARLYYGLDHPDFNYVIRSGKPSEADSEFNHWYLSIVPRIDMASGFELGSGIYLNPLAPEMTAEFLRNVKIPALT